MLRAAIVGCGKIADQHVLAIGRIPGAQVVGACDREALMAEQLAERYAIGHASSELQRLLDEVRPAVVHITTPPQSHFSLARQCLEAGCHVYVEKPFTVDAYEAESLVRLAADRGLKLTAGHNLQYTWESIEARKLIRAGFLGGPPVHIESYYTYNLGDGAYAKALLGDPNHWVRRLPGQLLHNIISHGIARIAEYMEVDEPLVAAFGHTSPALRGLGETEMIDELRVHVSDGRNMTASFVFSSQIAPPANGVRFYGSANSLVVDNLQRTVVRLRHGRYRSYLNHVLPPVLMAREYLANSRRNMSRFLRRDFHDDSGLKNLIEGFYAAVLGQAPLPLTYGEILLTSRIMDAIFSTCRQRAKDLPSGPPLVAPCLPTF
jgi:predicted dehydrogenase